MSEEFVLFIFGLTVGAVVSGCSMSEISNKRWEHKMAKAGVAEYVVNPQTGMVTWRLKTPDNPPPSETREERAPKMKLKGEK